MTVLDRIRLTVQTSMKEGPQKGPFFFHPQRHSKGGVLVAMVGWTPV